MNVPLPSLQGPRACSTRWVRPGLIAIVWLAAYLLALGIGAAQGQSSESNPTARLGGPDAPTNTLAARLAEARANLATAEALGDAALTNAPAGVALQDIAMRRALLQRLVRLLEQYLSNVGQWEAAKNHREGIARESTLIPNSTLLENNLTNWTYSNRKVRFAVTVGVAYGSDPRQVTQLMNEAAERHGLVEKDPKPQVLFTEFGASVLSFELRFWVDVTTANAAQVSSDLRQMIAGAFAEQGIVIAFPQRDVHLFAGRPIPVEVISPSQGQPLAPCIHDPAASNS